ncbi:rRNA processing protein Ebp2 [Schizosaccharomyces cryophilus OY26]|uniref:rRNA processing protein Ebp2 n=1 Tax=Schizosaccharomyces cryophilus (strain OY26 / ATCC MYA-4695 / CBS 11777 / NBRC 106824 / NRRL Y48691) TaxID=653667 RepID=S9X3L0_SCHCR|nr:rRNA processing protein Ebp2 [Schizosaccharomyces cryophilus OY26]EPY51692.1 rRNA processing protein Ebp2 [Schizosaccharomyces cryophilus OY26]
MAGVDAKGRRAQKKSMKATQKKKGVAEQKQEPISDVSAESHENSDSVSQKNSSNNEEKSEEQGETRVQEKLPEKEKPQHQQETKVDDQDEDEDEEEEDEDEVELSDLEGVELEEDADLVRKRKLALNNTIALESIYEKLKYPDDISIVENQAVTTKEPIVIADVEDDLTRELAFYKQGVESTKAAFAQLEKHKVPITRPSDYFAEMLKSDAHMEKVRQELVKEATAKKLSEQAKKQRGLKKFGKQVQVAKQEERQRTKRETLEKINLLKRKHTGSDLTTEDDFDVTLAKAEKEEKAKAKAPANKKGDRQPNLKRQKKDEKFGFGGRKRGTKSNDADSLAATEFGRKGLKALKGNKSRPGKARRQKARK